MIVFQMHGHVRIDAFDFKFLGNGIHQPAFRRFFFLNQITSQGEVFKMSLPVLVGEGFGQALTGLAVKVAEKCLAHSSQRTLMALWPDALLGDSKTAQRSFIRNFFL